MPLPIAAIPPAGAALAGAAVAAKAFALQAGPVIFDAASATSAVWLLRHFWRHKVPEWAKEDVSFQNLLRRKNKTFKVAKENANDATSTGNEHRALTASEREEREMASLASVLEKLRALIDSVQLEDDHPSIMQQNFSFLAYIQLSAQIKRREQHQKQPQLKSDTLESRTEEKKDDENTGGIFWMSRDSMYENARPSQATRACIPPEYRDFIQNPHDGPVKTTLQQALHFATWAYYESPIIIAEKLGADYEILDHSLSTPKPGHVAYYVAVSTVSKKQLIIGLRGTTTLEDLLTDCCGRPIPMDDRPYYYDHDRGTKLNRRSNAQQDFSRIEVKAASPLQVVHLYDGYDSGNDNENDTEESQQNRRAEAVEVISGHERIWIEDSSVLLSSTRSASIARERDSMDEQLANDGHLPRCHEGIYLSAKRLVDRVQAQVEHWVVQRGYQLVLCGHSLGAGCASLAAVLLRSRLPELTDESSASAPKMRVYCFAPPPVLDQDSALACSSYCTSVVNNADMIPRCSLENLLILLEVLKGIWEELKKQGLAPTGPGTFTSFLRKIAKGSADEHMLMTAPALRTLMLVARKKIRDDHQSTNGKLSQQINADRTIIEVQNRRLNDEDVAVNECATELHDRTKRYVSPTPLYIPGIVLLAHEPWWGSNSLREKKDEAQSRKSEVLDDEILPSGDKSDDTTIRGVDVSPPLNTSWNITDGTDLVLRFLEMDLSSRMAVDHATTSYYSILGLEYDF